jgi:hypothetical protein
MAMKDTLNEILYFRMAERLTLTTVIVLIALVVMVGFWRTVQKIDLTEGGKLGIAGSFAFSTPVFVLLTIVGYTWVSLTNQITLETAPGGGTGSATLIVGEGKGIETDAELQELLREVRAREAADAAPPEDRDNDLATLEELLWAINCTARGREIPLPVMRGFVSAKLALIEPLWDPVLWGPFERFETWARSGEGPQPAEVPMAIYTGVDPRC